MCPWVEASNTIQGYKLKCKWSLEKGSFLDRLDDHLYFFICAWACVCGGIANIGCGGRTSADNDKPAQDELIDIIRKHTTKVTFENKRAVLIELLDDAAAVGVFECSLYLVHVLLSASSTADRGCILLLK